MILKLRAWKSGRRGRARKWRPVLTSASSRTRLRQLPGGEFATSVIPARSLQENRDERQGPGRLKGRRLLAGDAGIVRGEFHARLMLLGALGGIDWVLVLRHRTRDDGSALHQSRCLCRCFLNGGNYPARSRDRGGLNCGAW